MPQTHRRTHRHAHTHTSMYTHIHTLLISQLRIYKSPSIGHAGCGKGRSQSAKCGQGGRQWGKHGGSGLAIKALRTRITTDSEVWAYTATCTKAQLWSLSLCCMCDFVCVFVCLFVCLSLSPSSVPFHVCFISLYLSCFHAFRVKGSGLTIGAETHV